MKILFVTRPIVPPWNEGSKNTVFGLAKQMKEHEIHLLTAKGVSFSEPNIVAEPIFSKTGLVSGRTLGQKLRLFLRIAKRDDIDILHFFFKPSPIVALTAKIALKISGKKTIQTFVSIPHRNKDIRKSIFSKNLAVGSSFMKELLAKNGLNARLIPFGIDFSEFSKPCNAKEAKRKFGLENAKAILFAGNLTPSEGIKVVANSIQAVAKKFPKAKFVFACRFLGTKKELKSLNAVKQGLRQKGLEKNAVFLGEVGNMKSLLMASDLVVLPAISMCSKVDCPLVLLEAMALGKPVIFSNTRPLDELFEKGSNIMVERNDSAGLSDSINSILSNRARAAFLGRNAKLLVSKKFGIKKMSKSYLSFYKEILEEGFKHDKH